MRLRTALLPALALAIATGALQLGCRRPSGELREWKPEDHDRTDDPSGGSGARGPRGASDKGALVEATWRSQCATCHGAGGRGDGPQGPMAKARDLTAADFQSKTSDADIAAVITKGRGKMPAFELPAEVVQGLVGKIRSFGGR